MDTTISAANIVPGKYQDTVHVAYNDGTEEDLFSYYNDELGFCAEEFIGITKKDALSLFHARDVAYLRS